MSRLEWELGIENNRQKQQNIMLWKEKRNKAKQLQHNNKSDKKTKKKKSLRNTCTPIYRLVNFQADAKQILK